MFKGWAEGNTYIYKLLSGDISLLPDYVEYIVASKIDKDMVTKLLNVMYAANRYQLDVNDILLRFKPEINSLSEQSLSGNMCTQQVLSEQFARLSYELAYYYLHRDHYTDGFKYLMYSMVSYHTLNNETYYINCLGLFERFRAHADPETKEKYSKFIEKVWLDNVEKNGSFDCCD